MIGYSFAFTSDFNKALIAASRVFQLLDRQPLIDGSNSAGLQVGVVGGKVVVKDVGFSYPSR